MDRIIHFSLVSYAPIVLVKKKNHEGIIVADMTARVYLNQKGKSIMWPHVMKNMYMAWSWWCGVHEYELCIDSGYGEDKHSICWLEGVPWLSGKVRKQIGWGTFTKKATN